MLENVSPALQERLGLEGMVGLLALLETTRQEWVAEVKEESVQRFEHRLSAEISMLGLEVAQSIDELRIDLKADIGRLETSVHRAVLTQTRWMFGMWVGQLAAAAAIVGARLQVFMQ